MALPKNRHSWGVSFRKLICHILILNHIWVSSLSCVHATHSLGGSEAATDIEERDWQRFKRTQVKIDLTPLSSDPDSEFYGLRLRAYTKKTNEDSLEEQSDKATLLESSQSPFNLLQTVLHPSSIDHLLPQMSANNRGVRWHIDGLDLFIDWQGNVSVLGGKTDSFSLETDQRVEFLEGVFAHNLAISADQCHIQAPVVVEEELDIALLDRQGGLTISGDDSHTEGVLQARTLRLHDGALWIQQGGRLTITEHGLLDLNHHDLMNDALLEILEGSSLQNAGLLHNKGRLFSPSGTVTLEGRTLKNEGASLEGEHLILNFFKLKNKTLHLPYGLTEEGLILATGNLTITGEGTALNTGTVQGNKIILENQHFTNHRLFQAHEDLHLAPQKTFTNGQKGWVRVQGNGTVSGSGTIVNLGGRVDLRHPLFKEHQPLEGAGMTFKNLLFDHFTGKILNEGAWMVRKEITGDLQQLTNTGLWKAASSLLTLDYFENLPGSTLEGSGILGNGQWTILTQGINRHLMQGKNLEMRVQNTFRQTDTGILQGNNRLSITGSGTVDLSGQMLSQHPILLNIPQIDTGGVLKTSSLHIGENVTQWTHQNQAKLETDSLELSSPSLVLHNKGQMMAGSLQGQAKTLINELLIQVKEFFLKAERLWNADTLQVDGKSQITLDELKNEGDLEFKGGVNAQVTKTDHTGTLSFGKDSVYTGQTFLKKGQIHGGENVTLDMTMTRDLDIHKEMDAGTVNLKAPHLNDSPNSKIKAKRKLSMDTSDETGGLHPLHLKGSSLGKEQFKINALSLHNTGTMLSPQETPLHAPEGFRNDKTAHLKHLDLTLNYGKTLHNTATGEMILSSPVRLGQGGLFHNEGDAYIGRSSSLTIPAKMTQDPLCEFMNNYPDWSGHLFQHMSNAGNLTLAGGSWRVRGTLYNAPKGVLIPEVGAHLLYNGFGNDGTIVAPHGMDISSVHPKNPLRLTGGWQSDELLTLQAPDIDVIGEVQTAKGSKIATHRMTLHPQALWMGKGTADHSWVIEHLLVQEGSLRTEGLLRIRDAQSQKKGNRTLTLTFKGQTETPRGSLILAKEMSLSEKALWQDGGESTHWNLQKLFQNEGEISAHMWHVRMGEDLPETLPANQWARGINRNILLIGGNGLIDGDSFSNMKTLHVGGDLTAALKEGREFCQGGELLSNGTIKLKASILSAYDASVTRAGNELFLNTTYPLVGTWAGLQHLSWTGVWNQTAPHPLMRSKGNLISPVKTTLKVPQDFYHEGKALLNGLHLYMPPGSLFTNTPTGTLELHNPVSLGYDFNILNQGIFKATFFPPVNKPAHLIYRPSLTQEDSLWYRTKEWQKWYNGQSPWHLLRNIDNRHHMLLSGGVWRVAGTISNAPGGVLQMGGGEPFTFHDLRNLGTVHGEDGLTLESHAKDGHLSLAGRWESPAFLHLKTSKKLTTEPTGVLVSPKESRIYASHGWINEGKSHLSKLSLLISPGSTLLNTGEMFLEQPVSLGYDFNLDNKGHFAVGCLEAPSQASSSLFFQPKDWPVPNAVYAKDSLDWVNGKGAYHLLRTIKNEGDFFLSGSGKNWNLSGDIVNSKILKIGGGLNLRGTLQPQNQGIIRFLTDGRMSSIQLPFLITGEYQGEESLAFQYPFITNEEGKVRTRQGDLILTSTVGDVVNGKAKRITKKVREPKPQKFSNGLEVGPDYVYVPWKGGKHKLTHWEISPGIGSDKTGTAKTLKLRGLRENDGWVLNFKDKMAPPLLKGETDFMDGGTSIAHLTQNGALLQGGRKLLVKSAKNILNHFGMMQSLNDDTELTAAMLTDNMGGTIFSPCNIVISSPTLRNRMNSEMMVAVSDYETIYARYSGHLHAVKAHTRWLHPASDPAMILSTQSSIKINTKDGENYGSRILGAKSLLFEEKSALPVTFKNTNAVFRKETVFDKGKIEPYIAYLGQYHGTLQGGQSIIVNVPVGFWQQEGGMNAPKQVMVYQNMVMDGGIDKLAVQLQGEILRPKGRGKERLIIDLAQILDHALLESLNESTTGGNARQTLLNDGVEKDTIVPVRRPGDLSPLTDLPVYLGSQALQAALMQALSSLAGTLNITRELDLEGQMRVLHRHAKEQSKGQIVLKENEMKEFKKSFIGYVARKMGEVQTLVAQLYLHPQDINVEGLELASQTGKEIQHTGENLLNKGIIVGDDVIDLQMSQTLTFERPLMMFSKWVTETVESGGIFGSSKTTLRKLDYVIPTEGGIGKTKDQGKITLSAAKMLLKGAEIRAGKKGADLHAAFHMGMEPVTEVTYKQYDISKSGDFGGSYHETGYGTERIVHRPEVISQGGINLTVDEGDACLQAPRLRAETGDISLVAKGNVLVPAFKFWVDDLPTLSDEGTKIYKTVGSHEEYALAMFDAPLGNVKIHSQEGKISGVRPHILAKKQDITARSLDLMEEQAFRKTLQRKQETFVVGSTVDSGLMMVIALAITVATGGADGGTTLATALESIMGATGAQMASAGIQFLINESLQLALVNKGNMAEVFKEITSKETLEQLAIKMACAGLMQELDVKAPGKEALKGKAPGKEALTIKAPEKGQAFWKHVAYHVQKALIEAPVKAAIQKGDLEDIFKKAGAQAIIDAFAAYGAERIGKTFDPEKGVDQYLAHKGAHGVLGALAGYAMEGDAKGAVAGAMGAIVAEIAAEQMIDRKALELQVEKKALKEGWIDDHDAIESAIQNKLQSTMDKARLITGTIALISGQKVDIALQTALNALENNFKNQTTGKALEEIKKRTQGIREQIQQIQMESAYEEGQKRQQWVDRKIREQRETELGIIQENREFDPSWGMDRVGYEMARDPVQAKEDLLETGHITTQILNYPYGAITGVYEARNGYLSGDYTAKGALVLAGMSLIPGEKVPQVLGRVANKVKVALKGGMQQVKKMTIQHNPLAKHNIGKVGELGTNSNTIKALDLADVRDMSNQGFYNSHQIRQYFENKYPGLVSSSTVPSWNAKNVKLAEQRHPITGTVFDRKGLPIFDDVAKFDTKISREIVATNKSKTHMKAATLNLKKQIEIGKIDRNNFTSKQLEQIMAGEPKIEGLSWHHHQDVGRMQLIPKDLHGETGHVGGMKLWFGQ